MSGNSSLQMLLEPNWRSGFINLFRKEMGFWFNTRKWWVQGLVWFLILNGLNVLLLWVVPALDPGGAPPPSEVYEIFLQAFAISVIGVIILMQSAVVGEKQTGTAAWILTNPVARPAFIVSKLIANTVSILLIIVVLQGLAAFVQLSLLGGFSPHPQGFIAAMAIHSLHMLFYIALSLMLGSFFQSRGPVAGISFTILIGQDILGQLLAKPLPWLPPLLPGNLVALVIPAAQGQPLPTITPILSTSLLSLIFILVAIWRFQREEF